MGHAFVIVSPGESGIFFYYFFPKEQSLVQHPPMVVFQRSLVKETNIFDQA
jgi:hypothetical protein